MLKYFIFMVLIFILITCESNNFFFFYMVFLIKEIYKLLNLMISFFFSFNLNKLLWLIFIFILFLGYMPMLIDFILENIIFLSLLLWMMTLFLIKNLNLIFSFFVEDISIMLTFKLILIELVSKFIQPVTLTIRVFINIMLGLLICEIFSLFLSLFNLKSSFTFLVILFEFFVFIVQSLVFFELLRDYMMTS